MKNDIFTGKGGDAESNDQFISKLRDAINNDKLSLHYQPRFNSVLGKADILEALVRWHEPGVGLFHPEVFIEPAEENGLIFSLDLWVFEQCCKDLKQLQKKVNLNLKIAVNISVLTCESIYCAQKIIEISERYQLSLLDFEFEITETARAHDIRKVISFCDTLKNYGAAFSLDDFGTGQSPLVNLQMLPIAAVKIDQCFVHGIGQPGRSEIIICGLIRLAKELDMQTIAEGVETSQQYWFMREAGCDQLQGFLLSRPLRLVQLETKSLIEPVIRNE